MVKKHAFSNKQSSEPLEKKHESKSDSSINFKYVFVSLCTVTATVGIINMMLRNAKFELQDKFKPRLLTGAYVNWEEGSDYFEFDDLKKIINNYSAWKIEELRFLKSEKEAAKEGGLAIIKASGRAFKVPSLEQLKQAYNEAIKENLLAEKVYSEKVAEINSMYPICYTLDIITYISALLTTANYFSIDQLILNTIYNAPATIKASYDAVANSYYTEVITYYAQVTTDKLNAVLEYSVASYEETYNSFFDPYNLAENVLWLGVLGFALY